MTPSRGCRGGAAPPGGGVAGAAPPPQEAPIEAQDEVGELAPIVREHARPDEQRRHRGEARPQHRVEVGDVVVQQQALEDPDELRHRVGVEQEHELARVGGRRVEHGRHEHADAQPGLDPVAHVAKVHVQGGEQQPDAERETCLQHDERREEQHVPGDAVAEEDHAEEQDQQAEQLRDHGGDDHVGRQHDRREVDLAQQVRVRADRGRGAGDAVGETAPREHAAEQEQDVVGRVPGRVELDADEPVKHERERHELEDRVHHGPEEADRAADVARP
jgi:hypothetical protein